MAAGGAVALVAGADFVLAAPSAKFYAAFAGIGIVSDSGGSYYLPRRMGSRRAAQFLLLNETLSATAGRRGRTDQSGRRGRCARRRSLGAGYAARAGADARLWRDEELLLIASATESLEGQLENEARAMARVTRTDDAWNAMRAVLAKQKPMFEGR